MSKLIKFLKIIGINHATADAIGGGLLGYGVVLNSTNAGGYMNPNVIDGYSYNPANNQWYKPSIVTGEFDFSKPAPPEIKAGLEQAQYWRELNNRLENVGPANGSAGEVNGTSVIDLIKNLPEIIDRYQEILPDIWRDLSEYILPNGLDINDIDYDINGNVNSNFLAAKSWTAPRDPLVLDLDGDGIETAGIDPTAPVLFDMDGDGVKTATGWIRPDDGIVVLDRNGNGLIDSGRELFGDATVLARGARAGQLAANGFEALADLDLNADGRLDSLDASWGQLRIWRDLNQDGVSQAGELTTLAAQGIASLGAQGTQSNVNLGGGNTQVMSGSFTRTNGMLGTSGVAEVAGSLLLASNNFYRDFTDEVALTPAAQSLPQMQGSGLVRDLREAMSLGTAQAGALRADANNASNHIAPESIAAFPCKSCARGRFDAKKKVCRRHRLIWVISEKEQRISAAANAFIED